MPEKSLQSSLLDQTEAFISQAATERLANGDLPPGNTEFSAMFAATSSA
jgi:hypothetical protein